ncbi:hypothetical protein GXW82_35595 [Streptacidiphilus sp. 4-A2]|nr:hypothetical protein [Streptacidiphilus sp. 4-A2]
MVVGVVVRQCVESGAIEVLGLVGKGTEGLVAQQRRNDPQGQGKAAAEIDQPFGIAGVSGGPDITRGTGLESVAKQLDGFGRFQGVQGDVSGLQGGEVMAGDDQGSVWWGGQQHGDLASSADVVEHHEQGAVLCGQTVQSQAPGVMLLLHGVGNILGFRPECAQKPVRDHAWVPSSIAAVPAQVSEEDAPVNQPRWRA